MGHVTRITPEHIEDCIVEEKYMKVGEKLTVCFLKLVNGHELLAYSGCVDPANYDYAKGSEVARRKAVDKAWSLLGFALQEQLAEDKCIVDRK